jgi:cytochrome c oxidase cbb3-type subunit 2
MSKSSNLFAGLFGAFAVSCAVLVLAQQAQIGSLPPIFTEDEPGKITDQYPIQDYSIEHGRAVYQREGCVTCHTQQIRDPQNGTDIARGWGPRRTVARDYIYERPPFLGSSRLGPDLANVGWSGWRDEIAGDTRRPVKRDAAWHFRHLYAPRSLVTESNHPPYRYLFEEQKVSGQRSPDALQLAEGAAPADVQVVPGSDARALVKYLLSLDRSHPLKEAGEIAPAAAGAAPAAGAPPAGAAPAGAAAPAAPATTPAK